jgi:hypothetical protein
MDVQYALRSAKALGDRCLSTVLPSAYDDRLVLRCRNPNYIERVQLVADQRPASQIPLFGFLRLSTRPVVVELHVRVVGQQRHRHGGVGDALWRSSGGQALPKGLSWCRPARSRPFRPSRSRRGPTVAAWVGTSATLPPPEVRAFWMMVIGCRSTTRVPSLRYSSGEGGGRGTCPSRGRVVEGPVLDLALAALHHHAADAS